MNIRTVVFSLTLLLSSFLLFLVQPMIGRLVLPSLGGTPAVWNGCMLFFQAVLLAGYAWAHYGPPRLGLRNHLLVHLVLLGCVCFCLPMKMVEGWAAPVDSNPMGWLLGQLTLCVGLPFFVISSSAPLLQRWFSVSGLAGEKEEPWFLYAISNVGSLAALAAYPLLFERVMGLSNQGWLWTFGFMSLALMFILCAWQTLTRTDPSLLRRNASHDKTAPLKWKLRLKYILLAAIPSSLMLGVTTVVATEVGSFPLMWSIPLALYLLTFVFVFSRRQLIPHRWLIRLMPTMLLLMPIFSLIDLGQSPALMIGVHFATFFVVAMVCHGELARLRPPVNQLTEFYLMMSIGGVVGGAFNSLLAPVAFNSILEYPLVLVAACFVLPLRGELTSLLAGTPSSQENSAPATIPTFIKNFRSVATGPLCLLLLLMLAWMAQEQLAALPTSIMKIIVFGIPAIVCFTFVSSPKKFALGYAVIALACPLLLHERDVIVCHRGFFGVNEVAVVGSNEYRVLINGRTSHGMQRISEVLNPQPLSYYHRQGPVGDVFKLHGDDQSRVAVVGLGIGTIAAYGQPHQKIDFYEIDPIVCEIAKDDRYFTYLKTAQSDVEIILGDARVQLEARRQRQHRLTKVAYQPTASAADRDDGGKYGVIILDAFGSDAVPIHLLTIEAMQLYLDMLNDDGLLVVHISSKFMDFIPVGAATIENLGLHGAVRLDLPSKEEFDTTARSPSRYMIIARDGDLVQRFIAAKTGWKSLESSRKLLWTDEHANILDVMRW